MIGNTPLIRMERITRDLPGVEIYGKAEFFNPGGSVKDRAALNMILDGERTGKLTHDKIILDATSGNTGIAYAMIGGVQGLQGEAVPAEECLHGAQARAAGLRRGNGLHRSGRRLRRRHSRRAARSIKADPDRYFYPDQYNNPANWKAHYDGTALEILAQTDGRITHFVACMGTSGTFMGNSRRLHEELPDVKCISAQPSSGFHGLEGLKHMPTAIVPGHLRSQAWPTRTSGSKPKTPTQCAGALLAKKRCWWESRRARTWWPRARWAQQIGGSGRNAA